MSSKEFPNNWQEIHDANPEEFGEVEYEDFMNMAHMWSIPSSHSCVMRVHNTATNKIKEYAYRRTSAATKRLVELIDDPANVITICDDESIHYLVHPENVDYQL